MNFLENLYKQLKWLASGSYQLLSLSSKPCSQLSHFLKSVSPFKEVMITSCLCFLFFLFKSQFFQTWHPKEGKESMNPKIVNYPSYFCGIAKMNMLLASRVSCLTVLLEKVKTEKNYSDKIKGSLHTIFRVP